MHHGNNALIGYTGTIGKHLCEQIDFDDFYNSTNIQSIAGNTYELLVIAAPSGNRLKINRLDEEDSTANLIDNLRHCSAKRVVLISSVDVITSPDSIYGKNRKLLEEFVRTNFNSTVIRLATLIGAHIKKNIAYDLKHELYNFINPESVLQWSILDTLSAYMNIPGIVNLVSEPIKNQEIIDKFRPALHLQESEFLTKYGMKPYAYTKEDVFREIARYLQ